VLQVAALKNLNLNVRRAKIGQNEKGTNRHKFYITDSTTRYVVGVGLVLLKHPGTCTVCRACECTSVVTPYSLSSCQLRACQQHPAALLGWHSEKILKSRRLEEIRLTILNNLLLFHPESGQELAWGIRARKADSSVDVPLGARSKCVGCYDHCKPSTLPLALVG
jgi:NAD-dependent dihydropyrimidine dehydrogenase PreA subunit